MHMTDFSKRTPEELRAFVAEKREALRVFRFGASGSRARNVREGREMRKDIARALTELRKREVAISTK